MGPTAAWGRLARVNISTEMSDPPAKDIHEALGALMRDTSRSKPKDTYAFWGTQPVAQFNESPGDEKVKSLDAAILQALID